MSEELEEIQKAMKKKGAKWVAKKTWVSELTDEEMKNMLGHIDPEKETKRLKRNKKES